MKLTSDQWKLIHGRLGRPFNKTEMMDAYNIWKNSKRDIEDPVGYIISIASSLARDRKKIRKAARVGEGPPKIADQKLNADEDILGDILGEWEEGNDS